MSMITSRDADDPGTYGAGQDRWNGGAQVDHVVSPDVPQQYSQSPGAELTWPTAVWPGHQNPGAHGILTLNALLAPDMPKPALPAWTQWPARFHIWPGVAAGTWSGFGFWAHAEPAHAFLAAGFTVAGLGLLGLGAFGIAIGNTVARDADAEPPDKAGTRGLLGAGLASVAGAAATGAGFSGIGCMLAAGTVAAGYGSYFGWQRHNRHQAIQAVIAFAAASNTGPVPPSLMSLPQVTLPGSTTPYEARIQGALEAMKIFGTWLGSPQRLASDVWRFPAELPAGASLSPGSLAKKEDVLANNMRARRVEIEPTHGAKFIIDVYDGPDRTDDDYPWDGTLAASVEKPFLIGYDDAGRPVHIDLTEHMLLTGKTRMGKSALIRYIVCATLKANVVYIGVDCKDGAPGLGMLEPVMHKLATDPYDGLRIQFGIKAVAAARGKLMRDKGADEWDLADGPRIVVIIDERAELTLRYPQAAAILKSNLALVAAAKISYLDATQTPSGPVFGPNTDARNQYGDRIAFRNDAEVNRMLFGSKAISEGWRVEKLDGKGKFLIASLDHIRPRRYKALWVTRDTAVDLVARYESGMQTLDALSAEAFNAGMAAFDEAMAAGNDPLESFEPPPSGGGGLDPVGVADDFYNGRVVLSLVPTYPGSNEAIDAKDLPMWNLLGEYGSKGAYATDLSAEGLQGFKSDTKVRTTLNFWLRRGYVVAVEDGRANRFIRVDKQAGADRREA